MKKTTLIVSCFAAVAVQVSAQSDTVSVPAPQEVNLDEAQVRGRRASTYKSMSTLENRETLSVKELRRFACCNLGESFVANPSVDVTYADAATGAEQIRLLGLSGTYVQMLTENIPNFRFAAAPYGLGYVPGSWMQSIEVSKGIASVKQGYEAMTGQIDIEYKKPQQPDPDWLFLNLFGNSEGRVEANADATFLVPKGWGTTLLAHYSKDTHHHDGNGDGFADMPQTEQMNFMNRWTYLSDKQIFQVGVRYLQETRDGGQLAHSHTVTANNPYLISLSAHRAEGFVKNGYTLNADRNASLALILSGTWHKQDAAFGLRRYDVDQTGAYASLVYETDISKGHRLSAGLSWNYDGFSRNYRLQHNAALPLEERSNHESVAGGYAQYTLDLHDKYQLMAGIRLDHSNEFGTFFTPRLHFLYRPATWASLRLSAGKGYRSAYVVDENVYMLSGSRRVTAPISPLREEAWNTGANIMLKIPVAERMLTFTAEYYYTDFISQAVADMDTDPHAVTYAPLDGKSYSHVVQVEATYPFFEGFSLTAAYRHNKVCTTIGGHLRSQPLLPRCKGLITATYATPLEHWQFDVTLQVNGGGRLPDPYELPDGILSWEPSFDAFPQLSAQVTRNFRRFSIYAGGENLTNFKQQQPIVAADDPWGGNFDPTMVWGPVRGWMLYAGLRFNLAR